MRLRKEREKEREREKSYRLLHFAAVHYVYYIINGDAGLGNVGSYHNFPHSLGGTIKYLWEERDIWVLNTLF